MAATMKIIVCMIIMTVYAGSTTAMNIMQFVDFLNGEGGIDHQSETASGDGLDFSRERTCEGSTLSISCESGSVINVISANYGRTTGSELCPHSSIRNTACYASNSLDIVRNLCNGQGSCSVSARNSVFSDPCVGTYKYLEVDYTCESETEPGVIETDPVCGNGLDCSKERTCEGSTLSISCESGSIISVISANYGRTTGSELCPHSSISNTACYASNSLDIVSSLCNGQRSCSVIARNSVFSDPCVGTYKYLEVDYTCVNESVVIETEPVCGNGLDCSREQTCEGSTLSISCAPGSVINVISANYGRTTGSEICPHSRISNTACYASNSLDIVSNLCNGQRICSVIARNSVFSDPCVGTYKYLEVAYTCKSESKLSDVQTQPTCRNGRNCTIGRTCEGRSIDLTCPLESPVIVIHRAMYGRQVPGSDFCPHRSIHTTICAAPSSLTTVQSACDGRSSCTVDASNQIFGDPCIGTYKYLEIEYTCARRVRACEHSMLSIGCPPGLKIGVLDALYGRTGPDVCPQPTQAQMSNQNCRAFSSLRIVEDKCNGLSSCTVTASNDVFGDPCWGTVKYLEVLFECK